MRGESSFPPPLLQSLLRDMPARLSESSEASGRGIRRPCEASDRSKGGVVCVAPVAWPGSKVARYACPKAKKVARYACAEVSAWLSGRGTKRLIFHYFGGLDCGERCKRVAPYA